MIKNTFLILALILFSACANNNNNNKENIVFILVDDLGWTDLGYSGSTFHETPNIDAFSKESIQFTNAYASASVCSPSRAALMTGKHPARLNITDWIPGYIPDNEKLKGPNILNELPLSETTLPEVFKAHGYKTFFAGKWHLGNTGFFPEDQGFDINIGGHHKGSPPGGYYSPYKNPKLLNGPKGEYLTDRLTNESINFLDTIDNTPFFLYLSYYTVHTPIQPNTQYINKFNKKLADTKEDMSSTFKDERRGKTALKQNNPAYASMLYALDKNIGKLITKLKKKGLYNNTTLVFTSDNGGLSTVLKNKKQKAPTAVVPLRGGKGWLYEGGIRIPLLIKPSNYSGESKIIDTPVISHDFYPTLLSLADIKTGAASNLIDGIDLSPILITNNNSIDRKELFWHYPHYHASGWAPGAAIRQNNWKLIEFYDSSTLELYNLSEDISETHDLSLKYPKKVKALQNRLHELQKSMNANTVSNNIDYKMGELKSQ
ncbi:arylsulfatase [Flavivirga aquatica]|uniref:Arylsulfatase n=1 Tax=Flavivirga aquatica TaxID=1849968 RepID=A0A1E5SJN3_9FLAO|nr:sulfatase [Flavivirga aquatica]OEJ99337.1 arylsulfatase [Flavivirga aquatica]